MKTYMAKQGELKIGWHLVDASDRILGRMSTRIAEVLMGKHRPEYTPNVDTGEFVIVINADKIKVTGVSKAAERIYQHYSGYPGGRKVTTFAEMMQKHPERVVIDSVRRMLPKNRLGRHMLSKLKVYAGSEHPHQAQNPQPLEL